MCRPENHSLMMHTSPLHASPPALLDVRMRARFPAGADVQELQSRQASPDDKHITLAGAAPPCLMWACAPTSPPHPRAHPPTHHHTHMVSYTMVSRGCPCQHVPGLGASPPVDNHPGSARGAASPHRLGTRMCVYRSSSSAVCASPCQLVLQVGAVCPVPKQQSQAPLGLMDKASDL